MYTAYRMCIYIYIYIHVYLCVPAQCSACNCSCRIHDVTSASRIFTCRHTHAYVSVCRSFFGRRWPSAVVMLKSDNIMTKPTVTIATCLTRH